MKIFISCNFSQNKISTREAAAGLLKADKLLPDRSADDFGTQKNITLLMDKAAVTLPHKAFSRVAEINYHTAECRILDHAADEMDGIKEG